MSGIHQTIPTVFISTGPSAIGESYGGGYYAGKIVEGGTTYYLIVAPKSSGEDSSKQAKTSEVSNPSETQTLNDGYGASSSMNSSTYPAAQFCEDLTIGGYSDWYLPSRDELEICYRNLKPDNNSNITATRSKSSISYPEGDDVSGDTCGKNRNSSPAGDEYSMGNPERTSIASFKTDGSQAFELALYWSSSEYSSGQSWAQNFSNGSQENRWKTSSYYCRAVRRIAV